ncbi:O-glucosyltransferase rumi, partial [Tetrabaena socialis]
FFRGEPFCSSFWVGRYRCHDACPRTGLAQLSALDQLNGRPKLLDVGIVEPVERPTLPDGKPLPFRCLQMDIPLAKRTPIAEHSYYKWLLHMEGISASSRLSQLMLVNSVILFQRQPFIEYFYRSLQPNVHYVPFWNATDKDGMDDVYNVVRGLRQKDLEDPDWVQGIVRAAQGFALKFTLPLARFQYLKDALTAYRDLFPTMDSYLETYVDGLRGRGFNIR